MEFLLIIIVVIIIAGFGAVIFFLDKRMKALAVKPKDDQSMLMLQNQINEVNKTLDNKLGQSTQIMQQQFGQSAQIIREVTERLTKLDETNRQVVNFADQLQRLQDILKNPKQRGVFGEYQLEMLLRNAFQPQQYQMQYKFKDGEIVDAVIFLAEKILPIDSKFSLENYNRIVEESDPVRHEQLENTFKNDLKKRIDETAKYIRPEEGTMDFAFMFIPAEGIFYDLLVNKVGAIKVNTRDLIDYAINQKKVHIVSPTTFYVTLQSLWQGLKAFQIQEQTKEILKNIGKLQNHLKAYEDYHQKLGNHLGTTVGMYNLASKEFKKIDKDIVRIAGGESKIDPLQIEKPKDDE
ncbi:MAG: DNA recombination protein RmuC [Patescibacteria group bacterium]|jgi:DNA recombination protein RmuC